MTIKTLNDIRSTFLKHFETNGHTVVESAPLVPRNDPTLMFTVAGMVPFKNVFTGAETRSYTRATSSQKCVRAGGKHNDLENVGYTARHHTFFEMLGNFSFGDYFKEEAISLAWELVSKGYGLQKDKLLVTVYHTDDEAARLWKSIAGFSDDRIIRIPTDDNFWRAGPTGPCGPCTELFIDRGDAFQGGPPGSPDEDGDRFLEFWNLVFMQYEQVDETTRIDLPRPSIDTGAGLERLTSILQGAPSNYDIDLFANIIDATAELTGVAYNANAANAPSFKVIADHLRAMSFLIADGVLPSNEGRGYVLRRIMRRAMRHAHLLGAKEPVLHRLVPELGIAMGGAYPELLRAEKFIGETVKLEESRFAATLDRGLRLLGEETGKLNNGVLPGEVAFRLYDTYGFPLDLTQDILRGQNMRVDQPGFESAMAEQKQRARASWKGSGQSKTDGIWFDLAEELGATDFLGYATEHAEGVVLAIVKDGARIESASAGDEVMVICNQTPFYGESGGQVGDRGVMVSNGATAEVLDVQKPLGKLFVHHAKINEGTLKLGATIALTVDHENRSRIRANHSATHLLHEALRRVLGDHVAQKGSLVAPDRLRFDISQPLAVTPAQLAEVEAIANARILEDTEVTTRLMTPDAAIAEGAMALFGEKYGDEVRVVSMGGLNEDGKKHYSVELCGGTHVARTGEIGLLKVTGESAVSAGVRRIEAVTGFGAKAYMDRQVQIVSDIARQLRVPESEIAPRLSQLVEERRALEREVAQLRRQVALSGQSNSQSDDTPQEIAGVNFLSRHMGDLSARELKPLVDQLRQKLGRGVVAVTTVDNGKASLVVAVTPDLTDRIDAVPLLRAGVEALGGQGGGGKRDLAQGGGPNIDNPADALAAVGSTLAALLDATMRGEAEEVA